MDRRLVLEAAYEAISDSLEWGLDCKDGSFNYHVDGITAVVAILLDKIETDEKERLEKMKSLSSMIIPCDNLGSSYDEVGCCASH